MLRLKTVPLGHDAKMERDYLLSRVFTRDLIYARQESTVSKYE